jgi:hypothetical protein
MTLFFLPSKPIDRLTELPNTAGIYYVTACWQVFYVGKSKNLRHRWKSHHRHPEFAALQPFGRIHYRLLPHHRTHAYELAEIRRLKPHWNYQAIAGFWRIAKVAIGIWLRAIFYGVLGIGLLILVLKFGIQFWIAR